MPHYYLPLVQDPISSPGPGASRPSVAVDVAADVAGAVPSIWRSPTTLCPGGNMSLNYRPSVPGLPPGQSVVALEEIDGMPHPSAHPLPGVRLEARA